MTDPEFEAAVERYADMVFRLAYSYLKSRADAEDVMQETLLKRYTEQADFDSPAHERYWMVRVAVNECKKVLRSPGAEETAHWRKPQRRRCSTPRPSRSCSSR